MEMKADALPGTIARIELLHILLVAALWIVLQPLKIVETRALAVGALFMAVNFLLLSLGIRWVVTPFAGKGRIKTGIAILTVKMVLFLGLVTALLYRIRLEPLSFTLGFSSLLVAVVVDRIWAFVSTGE